MARVKLTEYKAKSLLFTEFGLPYSGVGVTSSDISALSKLSKKQEYVVKVDQGVKKRMKKGLVKLRVKQDELKSALNELEEKGYSRFIIEEMVPHDKDQEKYLAVERTRDGLAISYSKKGGIDIEEHASEVKQEVALSKLPAIAKELGIDVKVLEQMREFCEKYYVSFMEINPLVVTKDGIHILDLAAEVDSTAEFFVKGAWGEADIVGELYKSEEELNVQKLNKKSQAALSLTRLNPNGSLWVLLSGGGASLTIADEVYNLGFGKELGNYGEYSGNPNADETYLYTKEVLNLMMKSNRRRLMLIIGGGVANFTDIRITFKGVLKALEEFKKDLKKKQIKIFVRRGGPHEKEGLKAMEEWLKKNGLYGAVSGPTLPLHEIVRMTIKELKK